MAHGELRCRISGPRDKNSGAQLFGSRTIMTTKRENIEVNGRTITVSNLDKVLYPAGKFTKAQVIDYYIRISKYLLPHLKNRPVTLKRFPNGVFGEFFYEKDAPAFTPDWVETFSVPRRASKGEDIRYILINDLSTLVWLASLTNLEIHPFLHKIPKIDQPTSIVFDCDPGEGANVLSCARVALVLRELMDELNLKCWAKVSGSKGLQVYVPFNSSTSYAITQPLAKGIAEILAQRQPKLIVAEMSKFVRGQRVFIDWSQNSDFKTTVGVYSLRAKSYKPLVSMPVSWKELERAVETNDSAILSFDPATAIERLAKLGDLFKPMLTKKQHLPKDLAATAKGTMRSRSIVGRSAQKMLRRSTQGSKRRFIVFHPNRLSFKIGLEFGDVLKTWQIKGSSPTLKGEHISRLLEDEPPAKSVFDKVKEPRTAGPWDLGTYQIIEGSLRDGGLTVYLQGKRLQGEWTLTKSGNGQQWKVKKTS